MSLNALQCVCVAQRGVNGSSGWYEWYVRSLTHPVTFPFSSVFKTTDASWRRREPDMASTRARAMSGAEVIRWMRLFRSQEVVARHSIKTNTQMTSFSFALSFPLSLSANQTSKRRIMTPITPSSAWRIRRRLTISQYICTCFSFMCVGS